MGMTAMMRMVMVMRMVEVMRIHMLKTEVEVSVSP